MIFFSPIKKILYLPINFEKHTKNRIHKKGLEKCREL